MKTASLFLAFTAFAAPAPAAEPPRVAAAPPPIRVEPEHRLFELGRPRACFNAAETHEKIVSRRLSDPFRLLRNEARRLQGEALRARLCRWNEEFVYDIALLRRDGRLVHVYLNATSGQVLGAFNDR
jgi:hypothetical protein